MLNPGILIDSSDLNLCHDFPGISVNTSFPHLKKRGNDILTVGSKLPGGLTPSVEELCLFD